jgi:hypothetical protein
VTLLGVEEAHKKPKKKFCNEPVEITKQHLSSYKLPSIKSKVEE